MTLKKFKELLSSPHEWSVNFDGEQYSKKEVNCLVKANINAWVTSRINFYQTSYVICIGSNSLHYFMYALIASLLGIKIIFCSRVQFKKILDGYRSHFFLIISPYLNQIAGVNEIPCLKLILEKKEMKKIL